jgi:hypothetical protein
MVNTTNDKVQFKAQDSRLYLVAEALNEKNEWVAITYLPSSWCGNSYHEITLDANEYWSFDILFSKESLRPNCATRSWKVKM